MKRPVLKRTIKTVEIVSWTLEYEDVPPEEWVVEGETTAETSTLPPTLPNLPTPPQSPERLDK